jgi:diguanylate cyclase (GGDEF)-like protein/PAS domain S-box-containing protein
MGYDGASTDAALTVETYRGELDLAARGRERARASAVHAAADRREMRVETVAAAFFMVAATVVFWSFDGAHADVWRAAGLVLVCALLVRVEFDVGEGCTRPVQLVLASMLVLLPAGAVPIAVAVAHITAQLPGVVRRTLPPRRLLMGAADSWFSLPPAIIVGIAGVPTTWTAGAVIVVCAVLAQFAVDFLVSAVRVCLGAGYALRSLLRPFAWVWLVDLLLVPLGLFAAAVAGRAPIAVAGVLPLAALLTIFARERTGRIENAVALQRLAQEGHDRLRSIVQNASDLIAIVRPDGTVNTLSGSVEAVFGADWKAAQGRSLFEHVHADDVPRVRAFLRAVANKPTGASQEIEWRMRYADESWRHVSAVATNLVDDPKVAGIVVTARDVEDRKAFEEQLRHRAFHDPLTALANRALFYDRIEHALTRGQIAILYLDLDDFKEVNDRFGHAVGDIVLVTAAERLRAGVRSADTPARLGGDEFGVLLEGIVGPNEAVLSAERALAALCHPIVADGETITLTVSVGIAISDPDAGDVDDLLRCADLAMYTAKRNGKRRFELYQPDLEPPDLSAVPTRAAWLQSRDAQREQIVSLLERDDSLAIVFQPIMDLRTGRIAGYEALSRFTDSPQRPPSAWFAQAHRSGLGYELEAKALAAALAVPGRHEGTYLTVNLSPSALTSDVVASVLPERMADLVVEVTENELISEDPKVAAALDTVRCRGARLAVDDAGSGYAGLTQVMRLAPDIIKLDRTLVTGVATDPVKAALIESFVRYARASHSAVCAEGIEDVADLGRLADLDVAYGQGYGIGRPGPPWVVPSEQAAETCRTSFTAALEGSAALVTGETEDDGLEALADRLSMASSATDLKAALEVIARELHADAVCLTTTRISIMHPAPSWPQDAGRPPTPERMMQRAANEASSVMSATNPVTSTGSGSQLQVPVRCRASIVGTLEIRRAQGGPWSRFEIRRARIIANNLGGALASIHSNGFDEPGAARVRPVDASAAS